MACADMAASLRRNGGKDGFWVFAVCVFHIKFGPLAVGHVEHIEHIAHGICFVRTRCCALPWSWAEAARLWPLAGVETTLRQASGFSQT